MRNWLRQWPPFLFGSPQRCLITAAIFFTIAVVIHPPLAGVLTRRLGLALQHVVVESKPLVEAGAYLIWNLAIFAVGLAILCYALRRIFKF